MKLRYKFLLILIFVLALSLRLYGLNWDQGQHLHPDERFLTMVASTIHLPASISQYLDTKQSPLNPYNYKDYQFFVYGTFPLFITKLLAVIFHQNDYYHIHLVGRILSAVFDSLNIFSLYFLVKLFINQKRKTIFLPSLLYATMVLPIQLSHFFAVDTMLTSFILLSYVGLSYFIATSKYRYLFLAAPSFGIALACKISALYFFPIILIFIFIYLLRTKKLINSIYVTFCFIMVAFIFFRIFQPYTFVGIINLNPQFVANIDTLKFYSQPDNFYPPGVQWLTKISLLFPLENIIIWGLGLPLGIVLIFFYKLKNPLKNFIRLPHLLILVLWILFLFIYQGVQFSHTMRYFLPIYPFFAVLISLILGRFNPTLQLLLLLFHFIYTISFINIYSHPHSRVEASEWIYQNIPPHSSLTNEYWDDPLPLPLTGRDPSVYRSVMLPLFDPDTSQKWQNINPIISSADYLLLTSNRLWGTIPLVPDRYPVTSKFYQDLFNQKLSFKLLKRFTSYPGIAFPFLDKCLYFGPTDYPGGNNNWFEIDPCCSQPGFYLRDDTAEEAFTVYDHPQVLIFSRK